MLTIIVNGNDRDFLARAIKEVGKPDRLWIIDEEANTYSSMTYMGTEDEETVEGLPIGAESFQTTLGIFNGDAALVKRAGADAILDELFAKLPDPAHSENLPSWTKEARFRLIEIWMGIPGYQILAEKPTPSADELQLGQRVQPLGK